MNSVDVLGVQVSCISRQDVLSLPLEWAQQSWQRTIFYVNAYCLNLSAQDPTYQALLNAADLLYPDGIGVVMASRLLGGCSLEKITGRDWIDDFCSQAALAGLRLYILAGKPGVASRAAVILSQRYPGLQIVGTRHGFLDTNTNSAVITEINQARSQLVWVGMGSPRQERWLAAHRSEINAPVCWAVGALFDYLAGVEPPVPAWMNRLALEWFWRLLVDPRGKWRRYLLGNPEFVSRVLYQMWKQRGI